MKYRYIHRLFIVEGLKSVEELLLSNFDIIELLVTKNWYDSNPDFGQSAQVLPEFVTENEMAALSNLSTPPGVLAVARIPDYDDVEVELKNKITLVLDGISDPGNMGTIIRTADWFGLKYIICSEDSVDVFNQKVVQASMGSIFRLKVITRSLTSLFDQAAGLGIPVYGAYLDGVNIYNEASDFQEGVLVIGSESHGIRENTHKYITTKLSIPNFSDNTNKAESLNASIATAIILSEMKRKSVLF
ncbi:MAG: RNA methyltransferase [Bacteroidales bacterium]|nr:RNA methyltransferase [Bacteroidales bacterium]